MPRKRPPPEISIGSPLAGDRLASLSDEQFFERVGNRRAGENLDTEEPRLPTGSKARPRFRQRDQKDVRVTTVNLPRELLRRAAVHCAARETTFSSLVERLLVAELGAEERRAG